MGIRLGFTNKSTVATAFVLLVVCVLLFCYPGWSAVGQWLAADAAPAWVQAVGSVAAIIAATLIALYQANHARRLEDDSRKANEIRRLSVVVALLARSHGLAKDVVTAFREPSDYHFSVVDPHLMHDTVDALKAIPLFEIPSGLAALDVRSTARYLTLLADQWEGIKQSTREKGTPPSQAEAEELISFCEELMSITNEAIKASKEGIFERGGKWS